MDAWDQVLELYYGEDRANRQKVAQTGFDINDLATEDEAKYPFTFDGDFYSGANLVLELIASSRSLAPWTFGAVRDPRDPVPFGISYISKDRLKFSNADDVAAARSILGL